MKQSLGSTEKSKLSNSTVNIFLQTCLEEAEVPGKPAFFAQDQTPFPSSFSCRPAWGPPPFPNMHNKGLIKDKKQNKID
jgi:hypothetical protein